MPYFNDPNLYKKADDQSQGNVKLAGDVASPEPSGGGDQGKPATRQATGSGFVDLDKYLAANNAQAYSQGFQNKVMGDIDTASDQAHQAAQGVENTINGIKPVTTKGAIFNGVNGIPWSNVPQPAKPVADYSGAVVKGEQGSGGGFDYWAEPASAEDINKAIGDTYKGPKGLYDDNAAAGTVLGSVDNAKQIAGNVKKDSGIYSLLDKYVGGTGYNPGQHALDSLLIHRGGGLDEAAVSKKAQDLSDWSKDESTAIQNMASAKAGEISDLAKYARNAIGVDENGQITSGPLQTLETTLTDRAKTSNDQISNILKDIENGNINASDRAALGIDQFGNYGVNLKDYIGKGIATTSNVASQDESNKLQYLLKAAGLDNNFAPDIGTLAGTYQNQIDKEGLGKAIASAKGDYQTQADGISKQIADAQNNIAALNAEINKKPSTLDQFQFNPIAGQDKAASYNKIAQEQQKIAALQKAMADLNSKYNISFPAIHGYMNKRGA